VHYKILPIKIADKLAIKVICDKKMACMFYFARYINIIFNLIIITGLSGDDCESFFVPSFVCGGATL